MQFNTSFMSKYIKNISVYSVNGFTSLFLVLSLLYSCIGLYILFLFSFYIIYGLSFYIPSCILHISHVYCFCLVFYKAFFGFVNISVVIATCLFAFIGFFSFFGVAVLSLLCLFLVCRLHFFCFPY